MAAISSVGLGAGFLTSDLIDKITNAERAASDLRLNRKQEAADAKLSAYGKLRSAITEMRLPARVMGQSNRMAATSKNSDVNVTLSGAAPRAQYSIAVNDLATSNTLRSATFAEANTVVGTGKITVSVGDKSLELDITSSNNKLGDLSEAINIAATTQGVPINAQLVNTGSGYQMMLTSETTGAASDISISVVDDDGDNSNTAGLSQLTEANLTEAVAAQDASFTFNGIAITRSSNTVTDLVKGLKFELVGASGNSGNVTVAPDATGFSEDVQDFVDKYNAFKKLYTELTAYDPKNDKGGVLTGDSAVRNLDTQMRSALANVVPGLDGASVRSFAEIGIKTDSKTGLLSFDKSVFETKFKTNPAALMDLFAGRKNTTDPQMEIASTNASAKGGSYNVNITALATQGSLSGAAIAAPASIVINADNDALELKVDGIASDTITLTAGTYTGESLAAEIQKQINADSTLKNSGAAVAVSFDTSSNQLVINSSKYGSKSSVEIISVDTNTTAQLGLSVATGTAGTDVVGLIDGKPATGDGQLLKASDDSDAKGIAVKILGGALGDRGSVNYSKGLGKQIVDQLSKFLSVDGSLTVKQDGLRDTLQEIKKERSSLDASITARKDLLLKQFASADILVSKLNSTQEFLKTALAPQKSTK